MKKLRHIEIKHLPKASQSAAKLGCKPRPRSGASHHSTWASSLLFLLMKQNNQQRKGRVNLDSQFKGVQSTTVWETVKWLAALHLQPEHKEVNAAYLAFLLLFSFLVVWKPRPHLEWISSTVQPLWESLGKVCLPGDSKIQLS